MSKGKDTLVDSHVSLRQCKLAVEALHAHSAKKDQKAAEIELLPGKEQHVWLQVAIKKMQPEKKIKPFKIPIVHPLVDPRTSAVCLITKDPQREYKDLIESHGIKFISRVIGITKLKGKFKPFEARRMLLKENGMFLADERVVSLLPGLLGSKWFEAKKQPIPVCLTRKDLKGELERAISSTYMHQNQGTCTSIKIATTAQSPSQVLANLQKALPAVIENLKGGWDNVQSLHLKTADSVALPIWTCGLGLEEGSRWHGLVEGEESDEDEDEDEEDEMDVDEVVVEMKETPKAKGTKRPSEENVQEQEKPKKKAKGVQPTPSEDIDLPAPVPKKKRKSSPVAEPTAIAVHSAIPPPATAGVEISKKKRKSKVITPDFLGLSTPPSPHIPFSTDIEAEADIDTEATERPTKTKKAKRKSKSRTSLDQAGDDLPAAIADLSVSRPEAALAANTEQTNSKQSKKARTLVVGAGVIVEPMDVVPVGSSGTNVDAPVKKKKKLQIRREQEALAAAVGSSADTAPSDSVPAEASTTVDDPSVKKKKKKHLKKEQEALAAAAAAIDGDIDAAPSDSTAIAVTADIATDGGKNRKKKRAKMAGPSIIKSRKEQKKARASQPDADMEVPASVTLGGITKEELRQKRSGEGGEKKKEKVLKKSGKSAKDVLLGRKAGQS